MSQSPGPRTHLAVVAMVVLLAGCLAGADLEPKSGPGTNPATGYHSALLTNVRHATHTEEAGFDRVVLDFLNHIPAYEVRYVPEPVRADGSGDEVPIAGTHVLQVRMTPASQVFFTPASPQGYIELYPGPKRIATNHPQVVELVESGDFEAVLTWNIGTRSQAPFRVEVLDSPHRLVIDVAHG